MIPGERFIKDGEIELNAGRNTVTLTVANSGDRPIQVGSHYHFFETNPALKFDRKKARGMRLDGDIGAKLARPAFAKGGVAVGTALIVPGDQALVDRLGALFGSFGGEVGLSAWNGFAMARFCAQDAARLRADMRAVLGRATGSALPRLWLN